MRPVRRFWRRLRETLRPWRRDREFAEEVATHLRMLTQDQVRAGMSPEEARRTARLTFGSIDAAVEGWREQRRLPLLDTFARDVRLAVRGLRRDISFAAVSIVTLALAIGANTAIFSAVEAALIRPLPYPAADRLVQVWESNPRAERWGDWASYPDFEDWARESRTFDGLALYRSARLRLTHGKEPAMLTAVRVSPSLFSVLGVPPMLGRGFTADEGRPGQTDVAVLGYGVWQRQFGADPSVVGQSVLLDGRSHLVVGVMPPGFAFPANLQASPRLPDVWVPIVPDASRGSHNYRVVGRLRAGQTIVQAREDMDRVMRLVGDVDPAHRGSGGAVEGLQHHSVGRTRSALLLVMGAVVLVLLIACANVSGLLLARAFSRRREVALKLSLGATSARVVQQAVVEGLVLALIGAVAGLVVARAGIRILVELAPALPLVKEAGLNVGVLLFTAGTALVTGIVVGIVPTVQALRMQAHDALKEGGTRQAGSARMSAVRAALTVGEVAVALVLTIGAVLFLRSFANVRGVEAGFDPRGVLVASLAAPPEDGADDGLTVRFFDRVLARLAQVPGVRAAAASSAVPFVSNETSPFQVEGREAGQGAPLGMAEQPKVTADYFRAMDIALLRGRAFGPEDVAGAEPVAIVSKGFADRFWPGGDALDKRVAITDGKWRRIVGIAEDVRNDGPEAPARPTIYIAFSQFPRSASSITLRMESMSTQTMTLVREAVREVAPTQPLFGAQPMETVVGEALTVRRFLMVLVGAFAGLAVVLGLVGVYGVLAYLVGQRRQEIAVRAALGATRSEIVQLVAWRGVALGGLGITLGLAASVALSRVLEGALFGVSPLDPVTYALASGLLAGVVVAASSLPAWQAACVPAVEALRAD